MREVAERLDINIDSAHRLRKMNRFMSEQFVGKWDKKRSWFCDEDGVERLKNDEEYQKLRQRGKNAVRAMIGSPPLAALVEMPAEEPYRTGDHLHLDRLTFGYTSEELKMPRLRVTGVNDMW